ncbi:MAG: ArsR family transcriptional regulator [Haloferacaceae archaeon]
MSNADGDRDLSAVETDDPPELDGVLAALHDEDCRQLLEATAGESLTASELVERCTIPSSTLYRKLEFLTDIDVLEASVRVDASGDHAREYTLTVEEITLRFSDREGLTVEAVRSV